MDVETLFGNIPPLIILALDYPSWIMKVKSAFKILDIFDVIYEDLSFNHNIVWQSEAVAYRIVTEKIENPIIVSDVCHFNSSKEILHYLSSTFKRISSVPGSQQRRNFSRFVRHYSASVTNPNKREHHYDNGFGKGHGSDRSNWRKPEANGISNQKVSFSEQPITIPLVERTNVALMEISHSEPSCDEFNLMEGDSDLDEGFDVEDECLLNDSSEDDYLPAYEHQVSSIVYCSSKDEQVGHSKPPGPVFSCLESPIFRWTILLFVFFLFDGRIRKRSSI